MPKDKDKDKRRVQIEEPSKAGAGAGDSWDEHFSQSKQKKYWTNKATGESTWKDPTGGKDAPSASKSRDKADKAEAPSTAAPSSSSASDWQESFSASKNRKYWTNKATGESTWKDPHSNPKEAALVSQLKSAMSSGVTLKPASERDKEQEKEAEKDEEEKEKAKGKEKKKDKKGEREGEKEKEKEGKPAKSKTRDAPSSAATGGDWDELFSTSKQKKYWKNKTTGESTWKDPTTSAPAADADAADTGNTGADAAGGSKSGAKAAAASVGEWEEYYSASKQKKYWKNRTTGESTWKQPKVCFVCCFRSTLCYPRICSLHQCPHPISSVSFRPI